MAKVSDVSKVQLIGLGYALKTHPDGRLSWTNYRLGAKSVNKWRDENQAWLAVQRSAEMRGIFPIKA